MNEYYAGARGRDGLANSLSLRQLRARTKPPADDIPSLSSIHPPPSLCPPPHPPSSRSPSPPPVDSCRRCSRRLPAGLAPLVTSGLSHLAPPGIAPRTRGTASDPALGAFAAAELGFANGLGSAATFCCGLTRSPETPGSPFGCLCSHHLLHLASSTVPSFGTGLRLLCICLPVSSVVSSACFSFGLLIRCDFLPEH